MVGNICIRSTFIMIILNSSFATKDSAVWNMQSLDQVNIDEIGNHKSFNEDPNADHANDLVNYPYGSYQYGSNEDESPKDEILPKRHLTKRRGSKEKYFSNKESKNNHINSSKSRIKSQKRSKTNIKSKLRRSAAMKNYLENRENLFNSEKESYFPPAGPMRRMYSNPSYSIPQMKELHNENLIIVPTDMNHQSSYVLGRNYIDHLNRPDGKISPYEYLPIHNKSQNCFNKLNKNIKEERHEFSPENFNLKSLSEVLGSIGLRRAEFPQCPAEHYDGNVPEYKSNHIPAKNKYSSTRDEMNNIYYELIQNKYLKKDHQNIERNLKWDDRSFGDKRSKREQQVKTITLTFPVVETLESLFSQKLTDTGKNTNDKLPAVIKNNNTEFQASSKASTLSSSSLQASSKMSGDQSVTGSSMKVNNINVTSPYIGIESTESLCKATTCPRNFKELNEGNKVIMDLSSYVATMLQPAHIIKNASTINDNKSQKTKLMHDSGGVIIPVSLRKVIKLKPHGEIKRSNENSEDPQDVYIVQLLKDSTSNEKDEKGTVRSPKIIFSIPYVLRPKRQSSYNNQ